MAERFIDGTYVFQPAETEAVQEKYLDLKYMAGERHDLDIYLPSIGTRPFPVIIDIFGGGLWRGEKSSFKLNPALQMLENGYAVVSINYSLIWQQPFPTQIYEVKAAIRWLRANGAKYGLDISRVALMGESSGAHLAALAGVSASVNELSNPQFGEAPDEAETVNAIIALYGPYAFDEFVEQFKESKMTPKYAETGTAESFEGQMFGKQAPKDMPELVKRYNPATYFNPKMPPILGFAGTADQVVPYQQTINMIEKARTVIGDKAELVLVEGAGHGITGFMDDENTTLKGKFLDHYVK